MSQSWFEQANGWLGNQLGAATGLASFGLLLLGGVLASLLPCVYPLYPITAAVLSKRQSRFGRFAHPLVYYTGLAGVYFAFGIVASLTGGGFNQVLHLPAVNLGIAGLMVLLALATAGLLHFPAITGIGDNRGTGLGSTLVMGAGAGLLSSACVGPVVVSILISIAASTTRVSVGVALLAAFKMMLFGMGVGLPLLLIGVFGVALPRGGRWMIRIQQVFGLLIAWFAVGYVFKGLAGLGFSNGAGWALIAGTVLLAGAVYLAQNPEQLAQERSKKSALAVAAAIGFFVIGRTLLGAPATASGESTAATSGVTQERHGNLSWHLDKNAAYAAAAQTGKPVFVDFHGDWCTNCKAFQEMTLVDAKLNAALERAVLLKVRDTTALFEEYRRDSRFPELKVGLPFLLITDANGSLLYKTSDYTKTEEIALFLGD